MVALRDLVNRVWQPRPAPRGAPEPAKAGLFPATPGSRVVLVTTFGTAASELDAVLDGALAGQPSNSRVICLTDQPDFAALRRRGMAFEYLPPPAARTLALADTQSWRLYITERYDILLAKWRPDQVVTAGVSLEQFVGGAAD